MSNIDNQEQIDRIIGAMKTKYQFKLLWWYISCQVRKLNKFADYVNDRMCGNAAIEKVIKNDRA